MLTIDMKTLEPCNHIEADTRTCIFVHLAHAAYQGHEKTVVRAVDIDNVVLALSLFDEVKRADYGLGRLVAKAIETFLCIFHTNS